MYSRDLRQGQSLKFSRNAFTEFSDKKIKIKKENCRVGTQDLLCKRQRLYHCTTDSCKRANPYNEPNSCLSYFSDSLNSVN